MNLFLSKKSRRTHCRQLNIDLLSPTPRSLKIRVRLISTREASSCPQRDLGLGIVSAASSRHAANDRAKLGLIENRCCLQALRHHSWSGGVGWPGRAVALSLGGCPLIAGWKGRRPESSPSDGPLCAKSKWLLVSTLLVRFPWRNYGAKAKGKVGPWPLQCKPPTPQLELRAAILTSD